MRESHDVNPGSRSNLHNTFPDKVPLVKLTFVSNPLWHKQTRSPSDQNRGYPPVNKFKLCEIFACPLPEFGTLSIFVCVEECKDTEASERYGIIFGINRTALPRYFLTVSNIIPHSDRFRDPFGVALMPFTPRFFKGANRLAPPENLDFKFKDTALEDLRNCLLVLRFCIIFLKPTLNT